MTTNAALRVYSIFIVHGCCLCCAAALACAGFFALMSLEEADSAIRSLPAPVPVPSVPDPLAQQRDQLAARRHQCQMVLMDQLDLLSLPPFNVNTGYSVAETMSPVFTQHLVHTLHTLAKGRLLLYRSLLRLSVPFSYQVLSVLLSSFYSFAAPQHLCSMESALAQLCCEILYSSPIPVCNSFYAQFTQPTNVALMLPILRTRLGCMFLQVFLKKGHDHVLSIQSHIDQQTASNMHMSMLREADRSTQLTQLVQDRLINQWVLLVSDLPSKSDAVASVLPSSSAMWELVAQLLNAVNNEQQRQEITQHLQQPFTAYIRTLYRLDTEPDNSKTSALLPELTPAVRYLFNVLLGETGRELLQAALTAQQSAREQHRIQMDKQKQQQEQIQMLAQRQRAAQLSPTSHQPRQQSASTPLIQRSRGSPSYTRYQQQSSPHPSPSQPAPKPNSYAAITAKGAVLLTHPQPQRVTEAQTRNK